MVALARRARGHDLRARALRHAARPPLRALAFGDTVLEVDGELRVWPRHREIERHRAWYEQRFLPTLEALTRLDVERVLVTHGEPVLHDGARALAASLARPPWSRSSLY
jgi:hypothetical protein